MSPEVRAALLDRFVGVWKTEGEVVADAAGRTQRLEAFDTYEWMPGGHFLFHLVEGRLGESEVRAVEIIGLDPSGSHYVSRSYDNGGQTKVYRCRLDGARWRIEGEVERFEGAFSEDGGELSGRWERSTGGAGWERWIDLRLRKTSAPARALQWRERAP